MDGKKVMTIFGIDVRLHYSWWFVFALLGWSLSKGYFPQYYPDLSTASYWVMGIVSTFLLFFSVVAHEVSHSLVAMARKLKVQHITLFFFGGVSSIPTEDIKPGTEFLMAIAGPLFSLFLAGVLFSITFISLPIHLFAVLKYLAWINLVLGVFNLLPGYPLDGGRVFRALLMFYYHDIKKATHIASIGGKIVGGALAGLGVLSITSGGLWLIFLGVFLFIIAGLSYDQLLLKESLDSLPQKSLIKKTYPKASPNQKLEVLIKTAYTKEHDAFIIEKNKKFLGLLELEHAAKAIKPFHQGILVKEVMIPASKINAITLKDSTYDIFKKIMEQNKSLLPVVSNQKIVGVVTRKTMLHRVKMRVKYGLK